MMATVAPSSPPPPLVYCKQWTTAMKSNLANVCGSRGCSALLYGKSVQPNKHTASRKVGKKHT